MGGKKNKKNKQQKAGNANATTNQDAISNGEALYSDDSGQQADVQKAGSPVNAAMAAADTAKSPTTKTFDYPAEEKKSPAGEAAGEDAGPFARAPAVGRRDVDNTGTAAEFKDSGARPMPHVVSQATVVAQF